MRSKAPLTLHDEPYRNLRQIRVSIQKTSKVAAKIAPPVPNEALVMAGAEFLLSMVEARWAQEW